jgi:hypothetical protein
MRSGCASSSTSAATGSRSGHCDLRERRRERGRPSAPRPERQHAETMALYKQHNVNPVAGCVPILFAQS